MTNNEKKLAVLNELKAATKKNPITINDIFQKLQSMSKWNCGNYVKILKDEYPNNIKFSDPRSGIATKYYWVDDTETIDEEEETVTMEDTRPERKGCNIEGYKDPTAVAAMKSLINHAQNNDISQSVIIAGNIYYSINHSYMMLVVGMTGKSLSILDVSTNMANLEKPFKLFNKTGKDYYADIASIRRISKIALRDRICAVNSASMDELRKRLADFIGYHPTPQTVEKEVVKTVPGAIQAEEILKLKTEIEVLRRIVDRSLLATAITNRFNADEFIKITKAIN